MQTEASDNEVKSAPHSSAYSFSYPASRLSAEASFEPSSWQFDGRVTGQFDEMLARSIPQYAEMRRLCFQVGRAYIDTPEKFYGGTEVLDLGTSRGEAVAPFVDAFGANIRFVLCEKSEPMRAATRERYKGWIEREHDPHTRLMELHDTDIEERLPRRLGVDCRLALSVLTLMFTRPHVRREIVERVYDRLAPGGAFILVEKLRAQEAEIDSLLVGEYHQHKKRSGYTAEEIERKAAALDGVLVPFTAYENETLLMEGGFTRIECFWRWMNFGAWVAVK